jgi:hypothetical protein
VTIPLQGSDYFQVRPGDWTLPESATLPNGEQLGGARARLYWLLRWTAERGFSFAIGRHPGPKGWVPAHVCKEPWSGGGAGDRRLRDLRERGVKIESQRFVTPAGERTSTWLWRWTGDPEPGQARAETPPARLVFQTSIGCPAYAPGWVKWEVSPGSGHVLAPSAQLQTLVIRGQLSAAEATKIYLETLRTKYLDGKFRGVLSTPQAVLWIRPEVALDPLPTLSEILQKCGARVSSKQD